MFCDRMMERDDRHRVLHPVLFDRVHKFLTKLRREIGIAFDFDLEGNAPSGPAKHLFQRGDALTPEARVQCDASIALFDLAHYRTSKRPVAINGLRADFGLQASRSRQFA